MENQPILDPKDGVDRPAKSHKNVNRYFGFGRQPMMVGIVVALCCLFLGIFLKTNVTNTNNTTDATHIGSLLRLPITEDLIPTITTTSTATMSFTKEESSSQFGTNTNTNNLDVAGGSGCCPKDDKVHCSIENGDCDHKKECKSRGTGGHCCLQKDWDSHIWWAIHWGGCVGCCPR